MAINLHNSKWLLLALLSLAAVSGCCCQAVPLPGENQCPTDARRLYCACGEEAVRRCPCGPDSEFYGLKPTCWREWPEGWHCNGYEGMPYVDRSLCGEPVADAEPELDAPASAEVDVSNPFRSKPGPAELPLPPQTPHVAPAESPPPKTAPVQLAPLPPTPAVPPALEKMPAETPPAKSTPLEPAPPAATSTMEKSTAAATSVVVVTPNAPVAVPAIASAIPREATIPNPMPIVPAAVKMTTSAPVLMAPQNAPETVAAVTPNLKAIQNAATPSAEKKQAKKTATKPPATKATKDGAAVPTLSDRVEQHLINNLRL